MGGLAGHMMHPHDNLKLTVDDFMGLIFGSIMGNYKMTEKIDGFNIHILNKGGEIRFARNATDLATGGFGATEIEERFSNERVREVFRKGFEMATIDDRFKQIPDWDVFGFTINAEIVVKGTTNIMYYGSDMIIPHNLYRWVNNGKKFVVASIDDLPGAFKTNLPFEYKAPDFGVYEDNIFDGWENELYAIFGNLGIHRNETLEDYYRANFRQVVLATLNGTFSNELVNDMFNRFFGVGEKVNLRELRKIHGEAVQAFLDNEKMLVALTKDDLDQVVLRAGTFILAHTRGLNWFGSGRFEAPNRLYKQIIEACNGNPDKMFAHRWRACNGEIFPIEGVVVEEGGVLYKWTGPFAPINQLLGGNR